MASPDLVDPAGSTVREYQLARRRDGCQLLSLTRSQELRVKVAHPKSQHSQPLRSTVEEGACSVSLNAMVSGRCDFLRAALLPRTSGRWRSMLQTIEPLIRWTLSHAMRTDLWQSLFQEATPHPQLQRHDRPECDQSLDKPSGPSHPYRRLWYRSTTQPCCLKPPRNCNFDFVRGNSPRRRFP